MPPHRSSNRFTEIRFFKAGSWIFSKEESFEYDRFNRRIEKIVRCILGNLDKLQPFSVGCYIIFPYKKRWNSGTKDLNFYPHTIILYVEKRISKFPAEKATKIRLSSPDSEPPKKRQKTDSPIEAAIIQEMVEDMEMETSPQDNDLDHENDTEDDNSDPEDVEEENGEQENPNDEEVTPGKPGILKRMVRQIFPFFFRKP